MQFQWFLKLFWTYSLENYGSSHWKCSFKKNVFKNFAILTSTASCRDGWNVGNGSNLLKILHSFSESVDCVLLLVYSSSCITMKLLVLVLITSWYNIIMWSYSEQKTLQVSLSQKVHKSVVLSWKTCYSIHIQTSKVIDQFRLFHPSPILYSSSIPKYLYLVCWTISYISSFPTWIQNQESRPRPTTLLKKETPMQVRFYEYCEIFKSSYFKKHLRTTVSGINAQII